MADNTAPQGVTKIPTDSDTGRLWAGGRTRRATTTNFAFPASTTTPYSGNTPAGVKVYDAALSYVATAGATGYGEFDMSDATGFEVVISNNASTQTLSGITLKDYDTLPSGVTVPGQSYKTATNVATGASVTLSSLSLANNTAVRLWVPVSQSIGRQLYVNPTYGAAVTAGTGSLEVRVTPTFGQSTLNGSSAPLTAAPPSAPIVQVPYSDFIASATYFTSFKTISRNARQRTFSLVNTMDQSLSSTVAVYFRDDATTYTGTKTGSSLTIPATAAGAYATATSEVTLGLATHVDTVSFGFPMGATVPTKGDMTVYLTEVI